MKESDIQTDIMIMLGDHPKVAWCMVITTGKVKIKGYWVTIGHYITEDQKRLTGISDVIGQLVNGKFFCIEIKKPKETPTPEQFEYMDLVSRNKGVSGWCDSVSGAIEIINGEK